MHSSWRKKLLLISASNLGVFCGSGYRNLCWCFMLDVMQPFIAWYWFWPGYQYFRPVSLFRCFISPGPSRVVVSGKPDRSVHCYSTVLD